MSSNTFGYDAFARQLGYSESSNRYDVSFPALGRYQFTRDTIDTIQRQLNMSVDTATFLTTPSIQDLFYRTYVKNILDNIYNSSLKTEIGKTITGKGNGITAIINIYGLVAGAWLGGIGGLNNLFYHNYDANDGHTYVSDYIAKFSRLN